MLHIGSVCSKLSNFNYKPQAESHQQHLALYTNRHLRSVAIMIEVISRHTECTHFNLDYSQCLPLRNNGDPEAMLRNAATQFPISSMHS